MAKLFRYTIISPINPGAIGAGAIWIDPSTEPPTISVRNMTNDGWDIVGALAPTPTLAQVLTAGNDGQDKTIQHLTEITGSATAFVSEFSIKGGSRLPNAGVTPPELEFTQSVGGAGGSAKLYGGDGEAPGSGEVYGGDGVTAEGAPGLIGGGLGDTGFAGGEAKIAGGTGDAGGGQGAEVRALGGRADGSPGWVQLTTLNRGIRVLSGDPDPTGVFDGDPGSIYTRSNGELWVKSGPLISDWVKVGP